MSGIVLIVTVGGFFTITVCMEEVTVPHVLPEIVKLREYVPGETKLNEGLGDAAPVPLV